LLYPTHSVNYVPMQDAQGRWHEHPEMQMLPAHPGLRSTSIPLAGVGGELLLPQAPLEPQDFALRMVVNAVDANGNLPATAAERLVNLHRNTTELLRAFRVARMTQGQGAMIERHLSSTETHIVHGHLISSVEVDRSPYSDFAEFTFIFRLPYASWRGQLVNQVVSAMGTQNISGLANSTAPVEGVTMLLTGPFTYQEVTNQFGNGFRLSQSLTQGQAIVVNTDTWSTSDVFTFDDTVMQAPEMPSGVMYTYSPNLYTVGQASGYALTLMAEDGEVPVYFTGSGRLASKTYARFFTTEAFI
jgi:hypothetical protein